MNAPSIKLNNDPPQGRHHGLWQFLAPIASLRLTVVLFALALVLVFYGTLAQVDLSNITSIRLYFRSLIVWIPARVFLFNLPLQIVQDWGLENAAVPFPGGWLIGGLMFTNLLVAHAVHFKLAWRRSGILMIHAGLILMMLSEFITGVYAVEGNMTIVKGTASNYVEHMHAPEIALIRPAANQGKDIVAVVPAEYLRTGAVIDDEKLPCKLTVQKYMANSRILEIFDPQWKNPATLGLGLDSQAIELSEVSGTDPNQKYDAPSAYVQLHDRGTGRDLGTVLLTVHSRRPQSVKIGEHSFDVILRFKRSYRDYQLFLKKFVHDTYVGTNTPKDFHSYIRFTDPTKNIERDDVEIYMNHPFRYEGETFFQSSFLEEVEGTVLQVVRNPGWTLPYLSCIIVGSGMLVHFGITLSKFIKARARS